MKGLRQLTSVILTFILIFSVPINTNSASIAETEVIPISSEEDFNKIRNNPDGKYKLTNDIKLESNFTPIDNFSGDINGDGYVVSNLTIEASANKSSAAFIISNSGSIYDLGFIDVSIKGVDTNKTDWIAGIATINRGIIERCYVKGALSGGYRTGGICAHNYGVIRDSYTLADLRAKVECGGITAVSESGSLIDSCYTVPQIASEINNTGGISAYAYTGAIIQNCAVFIGNIENAKQENIGRITGRLKTSPTFINNIASQNVKLNSLNVLSGELSDKNGLSISDDDLLLQTTYEAKLSWNFSSVWMLDTALGRPVLKKAKELPIGDSFVIQKSSDLNLLRKYGNNPNNTFILINDIVIEGVFEPIPVFKATLNGNGYSIKNLTLKADANNSTVAFIINNYGVIQNLGFTNAVAFGNNTTQNNWASILVATNYGAIRRVYVKGNISGGHRSSGMVSWNNNLIEDSYCVATIEGKVESGGIVAVSNSNSIIKNCYAVPVVNSIHNNTGGISAYAYENAIIKNCAVVGGLIKNGGTKNVARIVGRVKGTPILTNNVASENTLLQNSVVTSNDAGSPNGKTIDKSSFTSVNLYRKVLNWDFSNCWEMDESLGRPTLISLQELEHDRFIYSILSEKNYVPAEGVGIKQLVITDTNANRQVINVIEADIRGNKNNIIVGTRNNIIPPTDDNGNYVCKLDSEGHDIFKGSLVEQIETIREQGINVIAGVNGEFYTRNGPEGNMIKDGSSTINGTRISTPGGAQYPFHGFLGILNDGKPIIGTYDKDWSTYENNLVQATGGQYHIVQSGKVNAFYNSVECKTSSIDYDQETFYRYVSRHPRTAAGIKDETTILLVTVDGRGYDDSTGVYIEELGRIMKYLGATDAINMDGGGSSTSAFFNPSTYAVDVLNTPANKKGVSYQNKTLRSIFSTVLIVREDE